MYLMVVVLKMKMHYEYSLEYNQLFTRRIAQSVLLQYLEMQLLASCNNIYVPATTPLFLLLVSWIHISQGIYI